VAAGGGELVMVAMVAVRVAAAPAVTVAMSCAQIALLIVRLKTP
jgi:hypothetical protein